MYNQRHTSSAHAATVLPETLSDFNGNKHHKFDLDPADLEDMVCTYNAIMQSNIHFSIQL